ncbi:hypothetical protein CBM2592_A90582 [Cupriavidus taiwanensis]|nr:hypothetical protein CBM2588_A60487 [Cupriavidus taiwanensis]SOY57374.1 hypothetical protein CBM2592_A90582 [Cupriavidus taiwanensis]SOY79381.1 hypothetical protein CBM2591_A100273 [Cupriavidus taiwanensis]SOZ65289.1 hypothetical protein CBM2617_A90175 [Cupriavidus taiwanensis]SOZ76553.1 hypothetical protein CBM2618_A100174 [Cupriavidus taiwanensis]
MLAIVGNAVIVVLRTRPGRGAWATGGAARARRRIGAVPGSDGAGTAPGQGRIARFPSFPLRAKFLESPALSGTRHPQARIFLERSFFF